MEIYGYLSLYNISLVPACIYHHRVGFNFLFELQKLLLSCISYTTTNLDHYYITTLLDRTSYRKDWKIQLLSPSPCHRLFQLTTIQYNIHWSHVRLPAATCPQKGKVEVFRRLGIAHSVLSSKDYVDGRLAPPRCDKYGICI